jgi:hypothetical protein
VPCQAWRRLQPPPAASYGILAARSWPISISASRNRVSSFTSQSRSSSGSGPIGLERLLLGSGFPVDGQILERAAATLGHANREGFGRNAQIVAIPARLMRYCDFVQAVATACENRGRRCS